MSLRSKNKERTRTSIIGATKTLIETEEFESISTRLIAQTAEVSYQTLYNYFPTKNDILIEIFKEHFIGSERAYQQIVRTFSGNLIDSLRQLNKSRFNLVLSRGDDISGEFTVLTKVFFGVKTSQRLGLIESLDQSGGEQYQAILSLARGMGLLEEDTDIQLMSHTLQIISSYAMQNFLLIEPENQNTVFLESLDLQTMQLVKPYLIENSG